MTKLYEIWPGKNRFCCGGRLMTGPFEDCCTNMYTWISICGVGIPYIIVVTPKLWTEVSMWLCLPTYFLFASTVLFLIFTQFSDPGIIPRKHIIQVLDNKEISEQYLIKDTVVSMLPQIPTDDRQRNFNGGVSSSYQYTAPQCSTCNIVRKPRSAHCSSCDNCVLVHDHHCPFVNNCVGKNNYRYFVSFICSLSALTISVVSGMICFLVIVIQSSTNQEKSAAANQTILIVFLIPISLAGVCILGLCSFHLFLLCIGQTTREKIKNKTNSSKDDDENHFLWFSEGKTYFKPNQIVNVKVSNV